jgi:hypothetical protein
VTPFDSIRPGLRDLYGGDLGGQQLVAHGDFAHLGFSPRQASALHQ